MTVQDRRTLLTVTVAILLIAVALYVALKAVGI